MLDGSELMEWFTPPLAHFKFDNLSEVRVFTQWAGNPSPASVRYFTKFELVAGSSVALLAKHRK